MTNARVEKLSQLYGESIKLLDGNQTERLHLYINEKALSNIQKIRDKYGIRKTEAVLYTALNFDLSQVSKKLTVTFDKVNNILKKADIVCETKNEGVCTMRHNTNKEELKARSEQLHLRVTPEAHAEIKRRATALSMTISDYIVFTTTHFDIVDIARKVDEINQKLDALEKNQGV